MEPREVIRIPCVSESRRAQIPIWADFLRDGTQIVPKVGDRRAASEPVPIVDTVNHEPRLEHERVRDHWVTLGIGILRDVEILLNLSVWIRKKRPLSAN